MENKTRKTASDVMAFLDGAPDERRRDSLAVLALMREVTGAEPAMWGDYIVGFGDQHYRYASGREGDWFVIGFSPRKQSLTLYLTYGFERHADLLQRLGKHTTGKSCLYIKRLDDVDLDALRELIARSAADATAPAG